MKRKERFVNGRVFFNLINGLPLAPRQAVVVLAAGLLAGCRSMPESMDTAWRSLDPVGHHRYHTEAYYPNERRMGIRLPKDAR